MRIILSLALLSPIACSSLKEKQATPQFVINKNWVRDTLSEANRGFRRMNRMAPVVAGDIIVQGNGLDQVVAYNRESGKELWQLPVKNGVEGGFAWIKDRLFFGANDSLFYSVSLNDGKVLWTYPVRIENLSDPLLDKGVIYFLSGSNTVFALEADSGKQLWLYSRQDSSALSIRGGSRPAIKDDLLYVGFSDGSLAALSTKNGHVKWEKLLNKNKKFRDIDSSPVISGDNLYVTGYDDALYCLQAKTGALVWKYSTGGFGNVLVKDDKIYYATTDSALVALKKSNGDKVWEYKLKAGIATSPIAFNDLITIGESAGNLVFLNSKTGEVVGQFNPGRGISGSPAVDAKTGEVFFISNEANMFSLSANWKAKNPWPWEK